MRYIRSTTHSAVKRLVRLHTTKERKQTKLCIIEGIRALSTALEGGLLLQELYCTEDHVVHAQTTAPSSPLTVVTPAVMQKISSATTPSGFLGVFAIPATPPASALTPGLVLAQIADPGNMGTLLRTAAACNVRSVVLIEGTDPWSSKVIQASAGTVASVQLFQWSWQQLLEAKKKLQLYALVVEGGASLSSVDKAHALLVVGNEARGIPEPWIADCDNTLTLPMPGHTESLNAAVAGSIALYMTFVSQ